jgi:hypothetical protein
VVLSSPGSTPSACSLGLSATSQQYFSLRTNQPPATSRNQPAVLFSQNKPAPAISHQPTEQAAYEERTFSFPGPALPIRLAYQPSAISTFISEQISTTKRTGAHTFTRYASESRKKKVKQLYQVIIS